ncbi:MAG: hypothetical protein KDK23_11625 [Leptospiraceae bacterium]|nr:hypothetical protein [Leptospiraceae bacterium]
MKLAFQVWASAAICAALIFASASPLSAEGCYICKPGSSEACKHYCRYRGDDDWENRKKCQNAGCDIAGTASCPNGGNYQVCYVMDALHILAMRYGILLNSVAP